MSQKFITFTKVFNWCTNNGCPKFSANYRDEDDLLTVRMDWNEFEIFFFIDVSTQDTLMEMFSDTQSVEQYNGDLQYCLGILEKNY
jgi:hypothetical protein